MTIPKAQILLAKIKDSIPYDHTTTEFISGIEDLTKELDSCYTKLRKLQNRPISEIQHGLMNMLEKCCCIYWRERMNRISGDYCPDCCLHGQKAGQVAGQIRIVRGPRTRL